MAYDREPKETTHEPHPDSKGNHDFAMFKLKGMMFQNRMEIQYFDYKTETHIDIHDKLDLVKHTYIVDNPKCVGFYWPDGPRKYGHPVSFHQKREDFQKEFNNCLTYCYERDFVARTHDKRINPYK